MATSSAMQAVLRQTFQVEVAQVRLVSALRGGVGVSLPLAIGLLVGQPAIGLAVAIGALNVAFSDQPGSSYAGRARRMLLASLGGGLSVLVGAMAGGIDILAVLMTAVWGLAGGLLVALGPAEMQIGLTCISLLIVFSGHPLAPRDALGEASLVVLGGVLQAGLAVLLWPVRPLGPERQAVADLFRDLASATRTMDETPLPPPLTTEMNQVSALLAETSPGNPDAERLRSLLNQAERIRLEVLALRDEHLGTNAAVLRDTAAVLSAAAEAIRRDTRPAELPEVKQTFAQIEAAAAELRQSPGADPARRARRAHLEALIGELRAALAIATDPDAEGIQSPRARRRGSGTRRHLTESLATLRANLTLQSAAFRHALRLAACLAGADLLGRVLHLPWPYWVPLTVSVVLRPEFSTTFSRGLGRVVGTFVGLAIATGLAQISTGQDATRVILVGLLVVGTRALAAANMALGAVMLSAMVVLLLALAGDPPQATIIARGLDTFIGGILALAAYATWPTWERSRFSSVLADLMEAYRAYASAVFAAALADTTRGSPERIEQARQKARLARTNTLASFSRLRAEPGRSTDMLDVADRVLASSHRFVRAMMGIEATLYHARGPQMTGRPELQVLAQDVDTVLGAVAAFFRQPDDPHALRSLPDLRDDERRLAATASVVSVHADQIANSLNTMLVAVTGSHAQTRAGRGIEVEAGPVQLPSP